MQYWHDRNYLVMCPRYMGFTDSCDFFCQPTQEDPPPPSRHSRLRSSTHLVHKSHYPSAAACGESLGLQHTFLRWDAANLALFWASEVQKQTPFLSLDVVLKIRAFLAPRHLRVFVFTIFKTRFRAFCPIQKFVRRFAGFRNVSKWTIREGVVRVSNFWYFWLRAVSLLF